jgi:hypothetical protein
MNVAHVCEGPRGRGPGLGHVASHGVLIDGEAQLRELLRDAPTAPPRIVGRHAYDQVDDLRRDGGSAATGRLPRPEASESAPVPANHGLGLHDRKALLPSGPGAREQDPEGPIQRNEPRAFRPTAQNRELLAQRKVFRDLSVSSILMACPMPQPTAEHKD